jgi:hypothetical protein
MEVPVGFERLPVNMERVILLPRSQAPVLLLYRYPDSLSDIFMNHYNILEDSKQEIGRFNSVGTCYELPMEGTVKERHIRHQSNSISRVVQGQIHCSSAPNMTGFAHRARKDSSA